MVCGHATLLTPPESMAMVLKTRPNLKLTTGPFELQYDKDRNRLRCTFTKCSLNKDMACRNPLVEKALVE